MTGLSHGAESTRQQWPLEPERRDDWPTASCCGEPRVTPTVDRCFDHAISCAACGQPSKTGEPATCCVCGTTTDESAPFVGWTLADYHAEVVRLRARNEVLTTNVLTLCQVRDALQEYVAADEGFTRTQGTVAAGPANDRLEAAAARAKEILKATPAEEADHG